MAKRFELLDALRACAVLLVVVSHAGAGNLVPGGAGVTVFFTISGFIITYVVMREYEKTNGFDVKLFYVKRLLKLLPPLVVCIVIPTLIYGVAHPEVFGPLLAQIFFVYNWFAAYSFDGGLPGSHVTWSLGVEEQFYIGFAIIWVVLIRGQRARRNLFWFATVVALFSLILRIVLAYQGAGFDRLYYATDARLDSISIGIVACLLVMRRKQKHDSADREKQHDEATQKQGNATQSRIDEWGQDNIVTEQSPARAMGSSHSAGSWSRLFLLFTGVAIFVLATAPRSAIWQDTGRYFFQSLGIAMIIAYSFFPAANVVGDAMERLWSLKWIQTVGRASYSIYLAHLPTALLVIYLVPVLNDLPLVVLVVVKTAIGVCAGLLVWTWVEKPVERARPRIVAKLVGHPV